MTWLNGVWLLSAVAQGQQAGAAEQAQASSKASVKAEDRQVDTLASLWQRAKRRYPGTQAATQAIRAAEAQLDEARLSPYFQFTATGLAAVAPEQRGTAAFSPDSQFPIRNPWQPVLRIDVGGAVPLYTFGKLTAAKQAARAGVRAARLARERTWAQLRFDVRRAYFGLQLALDLEQLLEEGRAKLRQAERQVQARLDEDDEDVDEMDQWRLSIAAAEVETRLVQTRKLATVTRAALHMLTGQRQIRLADCPMQALALLPRAPDSGVSTAGRPELKQLQAALEARAAAVKAKKGAYFPDLALAARAIQSYGPGITNQNNPFVYNPANYTLLTAGLVAKWSLDFAGNHARHRKAKAEYLQTLAQTSEARSAIALEGREAKATLRQAEAQLALWQVAERQARTWFIAAFQAYQLGTVDGKGLLEALKAYFDARGKRLQSTFDFNVSVAHLERVFARPWASPGAWAARCEE
ncbi:MAG: TolC family protein [Polyangiales bacterium]